MRTARASATTATHLALPVWRPNADKHLLAPVHKRVDILECVAVDILHRTQITVFILCVERTHVVDATTDHLLCFGPVVQYW